MSDPRKGAVEQIRDKPFLAAIAAVTVVGVALLYDARRAWLKAELG
jgi:hypothetical protein